jgi:hypothetical protein
VVVVILAVRLFGRAGIVGDQRETTVRRTTPGVPGPGLVALFERV